MPGHGDLLVACVRVGCLAFAVQRLPLVAQNCHDVLVVPRAFAEKRLLADAFQLEAAFFVRANCARVERKYLQLDAVQVRFLERKAQQGPRRIRAIAFTPVILVADKNAQDGVAVRPVNLMQSAVAEEQALFAREDGQEPVILGLALVIEPLFFVFYRVGLGECRSQKAPNFPIV